MAHLLTVAVLLSSLSRGLSAVDSQFSLSTDAAGPHDRRPLMRHQDSGGDPSAVHLGAAGEFVKMQTGADNHQKKSSPALSSSSSGTPAEDCRTAFIHGVAQTNDCQTVKKTELLKTAHDAAETVKKTEHDAAKTADDPEYVKKDYVAPYKNVMTVHECQEAANAAGASTGVPGDNTTDIMAFELVPDSLYKDSHPWGCFKSSVQRTLLDGTKQDVYYFNPVGYPPTAEADVWNAEGKGGTPICTVQRFKLGALHSAAANGGCPAEYSVVDKKNICEIFEECSSYGKHKSMFTVGLPSLANEWGDNPDYDPKWALNFKDMPEFCFVREPDENDGEEYVYFNQRPTKDGVSDTTLVTAPKSGTPACEINSELNGYLPKAYGNPIWVVPPIAAAVTPAPTN